MLVLLVALGSGHTALRWGALNGHRAGAIRACAPSGQGNALTEDALQRKLQSLRGRRRKAQPAGAPPSTRVARRSDAVPAVPAVSSVPPTAPSPLPTWLPGDEADEVPVWDVPEELRMPNAPTSPAHGQHWSLEDVFPGSGLAEEWDSNSALRTGLRRALRDDLMAPALPADWSDRQRSFALMLDSACMVSWTPAARGLQACQAISDVFASHGVNLTGPAFLSGLGRLCGPNPHGSLIDIIPLRKRVAHSWHQDCGIDSYTVLLGFPPRDRYEGGGVFSHHVKLSHPLKPSSGRAEHGAVVEFERLQPSPGMIPDEYVLRPIYRRGCEVWVSNDAFHLHSTPDEQCRECLWRFM